MKTTYAAVITLESLRLLKLSAADWTVINKSVSGLHRDLLGDPDSVDPNWRPAIFDIGLTPNLRDSGGHLLPGEGSFSLAVTSGEGEGVGQVQPASQPRLQQRWETG